MEIYDLAQKYVDPKDCVPIRDVRQLTTKHSDVAYGTEIAEWLIKHGYCANRLQTETVGNLLISHGVLRNVGQGDTFHDDVRTVYRHVLHEKPTGKDEYIKLLHKCIRNLRMNQSKHIRRVQNALPFWKRPSFLNHIFFAHLVILILCLLCGFNTGPTITIDFLCIALTWIYMDPPTNHDEYLRSVWNRFKERMRSSKVVSEVRSKVGKNLPESVKNKLPDSVKAKLIRSEMKRNRSRGRSHAGSVANVNERMVPYQTKQLRSYLEQQWPAENKIYSDNYLTFCLENMDLETLKTKLSDTLAWRSQNDIQRLHYKRIRSDILLRGSIYVYGYDKQSRPILWVRPSSKDWPNLDVDQEVQLHVLMIEHAIRSMHPGLHEFVILAKSVTNWQSFSYTFMNAILQMFSTAYCQRLAMCIIGPTNNVVTAITQKLLPELKSTKLHDKLRFVGKPEELLIVLEESQVPTFWGGMARHDDIFVNKRLDFDLMIEKQMALREEHCPKKTN